MTSFFDTTNPEICW